MTNWCFLRHGDLINTRFALKTPLLDRRGGSRCILSGGGVVDLTEQWTVVSGQWSVVFPSRRRRRKHKAPGVNPGNMCAKDRAVVDSDRAADDQWSVDEQRTTNNEQPPTNNDRRPRPFFKNKTLRTVPGNPRQHSRSWNVVLALRIPPPFSR